MRSLPRQLVVLLAMGILIPFSLTAKANWVGDTITCEVVSSIWSCDQASAVVGNGNEFIVSLITQFVHFEIDVSADAIRMTNRGPQCHFHERQRALGFGGSGLDFDGGYHRYYPVRNFGHQRVRSERYRDQPTRCDHRFRRFLPGPLILFCLST